MNRTQKKSKQKEVTKEKLSNRERELKLRSQANKTAKLEKSSFEKQETILDASSSWCPSILELHRAYLKPKGAKKMSRAFNSLIVLSEQKMKFRNHYRRGT